MSFCYSCASVNAPQCHLYIPGYAFENIGTREAYSRAKLRTDCAWLRVQTLAEKCLGL